MSQMTKLRIWSSFSYQNKYVMCITYPYSYDTRQQSFINSMNKQVYEAENIREIHETEQESEQIDITGLREEDYSEYFEIENEERRREESRTWNWCVFRYQIIWFAN